MKYWIPQNWDDSFEHEGLLFFVQKMKEMLFHFSSDIHRAPVHNVSTLMHEYLSSYKGMKEKEIKSYQLTQIYKELEDSFSRDKILIDSLGKEFVSSAHIQIKKAPEIQHYDVVKYFFGIVSPYYLNWTIDYLKKHIPFKNHKSEIEMGARSWVSELIWRGYSAEFIYKCTENFFIEKEAVSLSDLDGFFGSFNFQQKEYKVYFQIENKMLVYKDVLMERLSLKFEDDESFNLMQKQRMVLEYK